MNQNVLDVSNEFTRRHIGPRPAELEAMLKTVGAASLEDLIAETIPASIRRSRPLDIGAGLSEQEYLAHVRRLADENKTNRSYIGLGYYGTIVPEVIKRNIFENPGWYTAYTPYQAEIAQGRLEALLNFQTMVIDLTGLDVANASLLDEATAAAEAMTLMYRSRTPAQQKAGANKFFVAKGVLPQTIDVLNLRARPLGIELVYRDAGEGQLDEDMFAAIVQYPDAEGGVRDYGAFIKEAKAKGLRVIMAADPLALVLLRSPGELGADVAIGSMQRFGVPMGYGGPHAAYMAVRDEFKRQMPGRLIGVSVDSQGNPAYRMSLQTREQHIRREKATSNICTAQALLATMAGMYGVYHGPFGLRRIALRTHLLARSLATKLGAIGLTVEHAHFFDTVKIALDDAGRDKVRRAALAAGMNFYYPEAGGVVVAFDETVNAAEAGAVAAVFSGALGAQAAGALDFAAADDEARILDDLPAALLRETDILTHPVFNSHHSETAMMRYLRKLEGRDLGLNTAMIPLGSCTMKLNAAVEMAPLSWNEFNGLHPFAPRDQAAGYLKMIAELERDLCEITGFAACSLQPNSGAQGEYAGLMVIRAYHEDRGDNQRNVVLIPTSAHGTNPASAVMAGMDVALVNCDEAGNVDLEDLQNKAARYDDRLAALMITYPSTHGVFEEEIRGICETIHRYGGQVYLDGANMNAQVGLTAPAELGADVCHLNLHKTFAIPHGGGGPGMGPICVAEHLATFLPGHNQVADVGGAKAIPSVSAAPFGSALILLISYAYIKLLGGEGLRAASEYAILNANYLKSRLERAYRVLYTGRRGRVAHEMILDIRPFKKGGIEVEDIAKRLMDFGFHAPTMSWPIAGTLMVEPTESEPLDELDRLAEAMLTIREEIREIEAGQATPENNVVRNSPHTVGMIAADEWTYPYSREKAAFPDRRLKENKFWPAVGRIDNVYGDRNLICACPPLSAYESEGDAAESRSEPVGASG